MNHKMEFSLTTGAGALGRLALALAVGAFVRHESRHGDRALRVKHRHRTPKDCSERTPVIFSKWISQS